MAAAVDDLVERAYAAGLERPEPMQCQGVPQNVVDEFQRGLEHDVAAQYLAILENVRKHGDEPQPDILHGESEIEGFNPDQPRAPKGWPEGGQWLSTASSRALSKAITKNAPASAAAAIKSGCLAESEVVVLGQRTKALNFGKDKTAGHLPEPPAIERKIKEYERPSKKLRAQTEDVPNLDEHIGNADWPKRTDDRFPDVAQEHGDESQPDILHGERWAEVEELEKQYMREQLRRAPKPAPRMIGIDEIAIRKGHTYRIVVSDLERGRPIWFGGADRSEASMDQFFAELGTKKSARIELALMGMWKAFRNSTTRHAPHASILFDKFHVMRHLGDALDTVRKSEYRRLQGKERQYIKGQKYTLLSHRENLTLDGRRALKKLLAANKRLNTAYVLKESFGQLWDYRSEGWARRFFENWKAALKRQRLTPYEQFAAMIERHWEGIAAYCREENKVSLGFVERLNNKIRVIQRRAYGLRDEEYLRLKVLTCMLPQI